MKRFILTSIIVFLSSLFVLGQNQTDSQGRKQGQWVKYYDNSKVIRYKGQFKDDKPYGKFVYYYESGEVQTILEYEDNGVALAKTYFPTGTLMAKGYYLDQKKNDTWWYFNIDKLLISKEVYTNGKLNGISYKFFPTEVGKNPVILEEINYVDGLAQGEWKRYFKDGKLQIKGNYKNGLQQGECTWYNTAGTAEVVGFFKDGQKHGQWRFYDSSGEYTTKFYILGNEIKGKEIEEYQKAVQANQK